MAGVGELSARPPRSPSALHGLRATTLRLHVLFAQLMSAAAGQGRMPAEAARAARELATATGADADGVDDHDGVDPHRVPLGRPGVPELLRWGLTPTSLTFAVAVRTAVAAFAAGLSASALGIDHAYWAASAAVLVLHQGFDWQRTVQRMAERILGTGVGLLLAGLVFLVYPQGVWLVLPLTVLQFSVEILVVRNYALAVVFITPLALTIGSGGHLVDAIARLVAARGVDTVSGCTTAIIVYLRIVRRHNVARLDDAVAQTLTAAAQLSSRLPDGAVGTDAALTDRRNLQVG